MYILYRFCSLPKEFHDDPNYHPLVPLLSHIRNPVAAVASTPWLTDNSGTEWENVYIPTLPLKKKCFQFDKCWCMLQLLGDLLLTTDYVKYHVINCKNKLELCVTELERILSCDCQFLGLFAKNIKSVLKDSVTQAFWWDSATHTQPQPCNVKKYVINLLNLLLLCLCVHVYSYIYMHTYMC